MITIFDEINLLKQHFPTGGFWNAKGKQNSNLYKLIYCFAYLLNDVRNIAINKQTELNPFTTNELVADWEVFLGLPDDVITLISPQLSQRINNIILKLLGYRQVTDKEVINIVRNIFPEVTNMQILNGWEVMQLPVRLPMLLLSKADAENTIVIRFQKSLTIGSLPALLPMPLMTPIKQIIENFIKSINFFYGNIIFQYNL